MKIIPITDDRHLYSVTDVFPDEFMMYINSTAWDTLEYRRLAIGNSLRRNIDPEPPFTDKFINYTFSAIQMQIEIECEVQFNNDKTNAFNWWIDEPGFRPRMHTDGLKATGLQVYMLPINDVKLGTVFYNSPNYSDLLYAYPFVQNSGYLMLSSHQHNGKSRDLWHDMQKAVPPGVLRLSAHVDFGSYTLL